MTELTLVIGTRPACRAMHVAPATIYRHRRPLIVKAAAAASPPSAPAPVRGGSSLRALSAAVRDHVLSVLRSGRFADHSPAQVWATLLDEGQCLCSERTMYGLLAANGEVRERQNQLTHPSYTKPELLATAPNQLWSSDITKLLGPATWTTTTCVSVSTWWVDA